MNILQQDEDLRLRPVNLTTDIDLALPWYADCEVLKYSENSSDSYGKNTISGMYNFFLKRGELYIIEIKDKKEHWKAVGDAALTPDTVPIAIGLPEYRNRGYGKRALKLIITRAKQLGWNKLRTKGIWTNNPRSRKTFESVGFKLVKTGPDNENRESWFHELEL